MHSVNIVELKNNLSRYLAQVKAGQEIIIRDGGLAVARLTPLNGKGSSNDELLQLAAEGKIRLGEGVVDEDYWKLKLPRVKAARLKSESRDTLQWLIDEERGK
ncbi:MAG: type II toxin-antitoxin system Phd/YefM family antitoxin [Blastocatellales bacterium]